jgi:hypothetical protein
MLLASLSKGWGRIGIVLSLDRSRFRIGYNDELCIALYNINLSTILSSREYGNYFYLKLIL